MSQLDDLAATLIAAREELASTVRSSSVMGSTISRAMDLVLAAGGDSPKVSAVHAKMALAHSSSAAVFNLVTEAFQELTELIYAAQRRTPPQGG